MNALNSLSFFQPVYLWALGFLSVILFLHFFKRRIVKRMEISTLRFLPAVAVSRSRVRKLIELLLLLARLLLIIALIIIFAGPHDPGDPLVTLRDPRSVVYTWVDPTISMEFSGQGTGDRGQERSKQWGGDAAVSSGARAMSIVDSLAGILPPSSRHFHFDSDNGRFYDRGQVTGGQGPEKERVLFAGRFGPSGLDEAVTGFLAGAGSSSPNILIIVSDFQRGTVEVLDSLMPELGASGKMVICVSTMPVNPHNYVVRVRGAASHRDGVTVTVFAYGAALDTAFVELTIGGLRVGQRSVYCAKDDSVTVTFDIPASVDGSWGRVELHAADPLPFDNRDFFTIAPERSRTALIVGDIRRNRVIGAALRAAGAAFWNQITLKEGGELTYEDLNAADLVIVSGFAGRSRILESFISGAGSDKGIIIALDPDRGDDFGRNFAASSGLMRGTITANTIENGTHPVLSDTNTALWRGFPALSSANARVYRHINALPGDALARMGNGRTLAARSGGDGNIVIVATPMGITRANNICETGFFVPFIDRLGRYAIDGRGRQNEEERYAGYPAPNPFFGTGRAGTLYDADAKLIANWSNQPFVKTDTPGIYTLTSSSGESSLIRVSSHPAESEMFFARPNLEGGGIHYFEHDRFMEQIGNLSDNALSYWFWIILGAMLCAEVFLWKRQPL